MAAHEPINYLDSILNEEEKRCEYGHEWRSFTISRSGRYKSKNKQRNAVDGKLFDSKQQQQEENSSSRSALNKEQDKSASRQTATTKPFQQQSTSVRDRTETYKSYYETNL